eukprot:2844572-Pleurochrysis_carterae.AAC.2
MPCKPACSPLFALVRLSPHSCVCRELAFTAVLFAEAARGAAAVRRGGGRVPRASTAAGGAACASRRA